MVRKSSDDHLSRLYDEGLGVAEDSAKARQWLQKAAEAGEPEARTALDELFEDGLGI